MERMEKEAICVEAMAASIANFECYAKDSHTPRGISYILKYLVWIILLAILSPKHAVRSKRMVCVMTPLNEKQLKLYAEYEEYFCFARMNSSVSLIRKHLSVLSPYGYAARLALLANGVAFFFRHRAQLKGYFHFTIEYYTIAQYMWDYQPKEIYSPNAYERYCTLFSYLGHAMGIRLVGIQDGAIIDIHPPAKLYCDEMHAFDEFEANMLRKIFRSENCQFFLDGFHSTLKWSEFPENGTMLIAIASQDRLTEQTLSLADYLLATLDPNQYTLIIYPHYRETVGQYDMLKKKHPKCLIETEVRHRNVDRLITFYSTIVYDFWSVNNNLNVFCLQIPGYSPTYYDRENVRVFSTPEEIAESIKQICIG